MRNRRKLEHHHEGTFKHRRFQRRQLRRHLNLWRTTKRRHLGLRDFPQLPLFRHLCGHNFNDDHEFVRCGRHWRVFSLNARKHRSGDKLGLLNLHLKMVSLRPEGNWIYRTIGSCFPCIWPRTPSWVKSLVEGDCKEYKRTEVVNHVDWDEICIEWEQ